MQTIEEKEDNKSYPPPQPSRLSIQIKLWYLLSFPVLLSLGTLANVFDVALLAEEPKESKRGLKTVPTKHPRAWDHVQDSVGCKKLPP